jgi:hypothetical protein
MESTTLADRKKELSVLLRKMRSQPSRDWSAVRDRAVILAHMLAANTKGTPS